MKLSRRELRRLIESVINEGVVSDVVVSALSSFGIDERDIGRMSNRDIAKQIYEKSIADPGKFNNFYDNVSSEVENYADRMERNPIGNIDRVPFMGKPMLMVAFLDMADSLFRGEPISEQTDSVVLKNIMRAFELPLDFYNNVLGAGFAKDGKVGLELLYTDAGEGFIVEGLTTVLDLLLGDDSDRGSMISIPDKVDDHLPPDMDMDTGMDMDSPSLRERQYR
jgi:hypothetical protein